MTDPSSNVTDSADPRLDVGAAGLSRRSHDDYVDAEEVPLREAADLAAAEAFRARHYSLRVERHPCHSAGIPARRRLKPMRSAVVGVGYVGAHGQLRDAIRLNQHWFR